jgi:hypothetical protein
MRLANSVISTYKRRERYALGRGERGVPARAVLHRAYLLAVLIYVFSCRLVADELVTSNRVLTFRESLEVFLANLTA